MTTVIAFVCMFLVGLLSGVILTVSLAIYLDGRLNTKDVREALRDNPRPRPQDFPPNPFV